MKTLAVGALLIAYVASKKYLVELNNDDNENERKAAPDSQDAGSDYNDNFWDYEPPTRPPTSPPALCEDEVAKCAKILVSGSERTELNGIYELLPKRKGPSKSPQYRHVDKKGLILWKTHFHRYELRPLPIRFGEMTSKTGFYLFDKERHELEPIYFRSDGGLWTLDTPMGGGSFCQLLVVPWIVEWSTWNLRIISDS